MAGSLLGDELNTNCEAMNVEISGDEECAFPEGFVFQDVFWGITEICCDVATEIKREGPVYILA